MSVISSQILTERELTQLHHIACNAIRGCFAPELAAVPNLEACLPRLRELGACFVTLKVHGELQGCIGSIEPQQPLALEVHDKALASAFQDSRFSPLTQAQLAWLSVEVSVLSKPEVLRVGSEQALLEHLAQHKTGLILSYRGRRALFLPQVWKQLPDPRDFVYQLKRKAGWPPLFWDEDMKIRTFVVDSIKAEFEASMLL